MSAERRTTEQELNYRMAQYEHVLARHAQLLDLVSKIHNDEELPPGADPITRLPDIEQRRAAAQRILPILIAHPAPLNIRRKEPILYPEFGNPLRWCANNIKIVIPDEPINFIQLVDHIYLAYDVIFGSFDVRSIMQGKNIPLEKRKRIGGTNDYLYIYEEVKDELESRYLGELAADLCWAAGLHKKGIQAALGGMPIIGHVDFLENLQHTAGYVRNEKTKWGDYQALPIDTLLTRQDIKAIFDAISTVGESHLTKQPLEDQGLNKLTVGGFRIASDLVTDGWYVRT